MFRYIERIWYGDYKLLFLRANRFCVGVMEKNTVFFVSLLPTRAEQLVDWLAVVSEQARGPLIPSFPFLLSSARGPYITTRGSIAVIMRI